MYSEGNHPFCPTTKKRTKPGNFFERDPTAGCGFEADYLQPQLQTEMHVGDAPTCGWTFFVGEQLTDFPLIFWACCWSIFSLCWTEVSRVCFIPTRLAKNMCKADTDRLNESMTLTCLPWTSGTQQNPSNADQKFANSHTFTTVSSLTNASSSSNVTSCRSLHLLGKENTRYQPTCCSDQINCLCCLPSPH